jgi:3-dehydroquinate synthase
LVVDRSAKRRSRFLESQIDELPQSIDVGLLELPGGERVKRLTQVEAILAWLDDRKVARRSEPVVAVGGGALLDCVAMAASLYRRGVRLVKVPTTLTGMVDVAVAAKTAVNFRLRKNLIGTFFPPQLAIIDVRYLASSQPGDLRAGAAEVIKVAAVADLDLFQLLERDLPLALSSKFQSTEGIEMVHRASNATSTALWPDLFERTLQRPLDFGHTISKGLETHLRPRLTHGAAVSLDMAAFIVAANQNRTDADDRDRLLGLIRAAGLPVFDPRITSTLVAEALDDTAVHRDGSTRSPVPGPLGAVTYRHFDSPSVMAAVNWLGQYERHGP